MLFGDAGNPSPVLFPIHKSGSVVRTHRLALAKSLQNNSPPQYLWSAWNSRSFNYHP